MANIPEILLYTLKNLGQEDLKTFQWHLINGVEGFTPIEKALLESADRPDMVDEMLQRYGHRGAGKITLDILKKINQNQLHEELSTKLKDVLSDRHEEETGNRAAQTGDSGTALAAATEHGRIRDAMKRKFLEKFAKCYDRTSLECNNLLMKDIYTELYVIEGCTGGVNAEHEVRQIEGIYPNIEEKPVKFSEIFKSQSDQNVLGTKVLTLGIAGVGKTASVHRFILDWAEDKCNQDLDFILFLPFRELNLIKKEKYSLWTLLLYLHDELHNADVKDVLNDKRKVLFILDGLDESTITLDYNQKKLSDVTMETAIGNLITNLIKGELLPTALIWITSRPAAAKQIQPNFFQTEIRGFNDPQKEEYFRKRIRDEHQANRIISHIKTAKSLHILCHIPVFCSIAATVLQEISKEDKDMKNAPMTLTEMYMHFLLFHTRQSEKYSTVQNEDRGQISVEGILKLGKLAFLQLQKGQLIFYENDLKECGIDVDEAVIYSGLCTKIFRKDEKIFSFVHLSFQEFLAAVFVFLTFSDKGNPILQTILEKIKWRFKHNLSDLLKTAIRKAIQSANGHLDIFLRFLCGLTLETNQRLLKSLQPEMDIKSESLENAVDYIKRKIGKSKYSEKSINLFHCLNELKDSSLTSEMQRYLNSGALSTQDLSSTQWSALVFVLLMSEETQERFELKKYRPSHERLRRLLPVVKSTRRALLDRCNLSHKICEALASVLSTASPLKELDLSSNDLQDLGVEKLSVGLKSSHCKLEILRLDHCNLSHKICEALASAFSTASPLKELDLSSNDLQDLGVEKLSVGLKSSHCKLEILRLSGCMVTEKGCSSLASALSSNPSHLKELNLNYNHPGESGVTLLTARLEDPHCSLSTLRVEHVGEIRIQRGLKKYCCEFTLDPNTVNRNLSLSDGNRKVKRVWEDQSYLDHPERFDYRSQVLSRESVTGRCYWEAEWSGKNVEIAVTYKSIRRKGRSDDCWLGRNEKSWSLDCYDNSYSVWHNNILTKLSTRPSRCKRVGVYVDCPAGTLSFYRVSSDKQTLTHLHTFYTSFTETLHTETLHTGFWVDTHSSVCLR